MIATTCQQCGETYDIWPHQVRNDESKYCSRKCKDAHMSTIRGSVHPSWKGGRVSSGNGYIARYAPDNPRASRGYVSEHILVAELKYGRPISKNEDVHHLNGIKDDNRMDNIVALSRNRHDKLSIVHALQTRILDLEADLNDWSLSGKDEFRKS